MTKQELTSKLIGLPFNEVTPEIFWLSDSPYYTPEEQGQIIIQRYFDGNLFTVLNLLGVAMVNMRTIINTNNPNEQVDQANIELDTLQNMFFEINTLLSYFPKA